MSVLIIAEAGVNHNGDRVLARKLIECAANSGADLVKFQTFKAERLTTTYAPKAEYQSRTTNPNESQYEMLKRLELSDELHQELIRYCEEQGIGFFSTGFDIKSVDYLAGLGATQFKIPSGEITNLPYLQHVGSFNMPIILSTGMATLGEIEAALDALERAGTLRTKITLLQCNTEYPTPMWEVNLNAMASLKRAFGVAVGYSDHTIGIEVAIAAVALGASVIEKHLTLDRGLPGPDHAASLEPDEFTAMVSAIRNVERALGNGIKRPSPGELKNRSVARKSIVAASPIKAGEQFTAENLAAKRPGIGISPMRLNEIIGRAATRDYDTDELIDP